MDFKITILDILNNSDKPKLMTDVFDEVMKGVDGDTYLRDRAVNSILVDLVALAAAKMIIRNGRAEKEQIKITEEGKEYLKKKPPELQKSN